jgi:chromosome segregation and condensation protein ScpB
MFKRVIRRMDNESGFERDTQQLEQQIEALLFASDTPLAAGKIAALIGTTSARQVSVAISSLTAFYRKSNRSYWIVEVAGGYQLTTLP